MVEDMFKETPLIKKVTSIEMAATPPRILLVKTETEIGSLVLKVSEVAAVELEALLASHSLTRGSSL